MKQAVLDGIDQGIVAGGHVPLVQGAIIAGGRRPRLRVYFGVRLASGSVFNRLSTSWITAAGALSSANLSGHNAPFSDEVINSRLTDTILSNDIETVDLICGFDIRIQQKLYETALKTGNLKIIQMLANCGAHLLYDSHNILDFRDIVETLENNKSGEAIFRHLVDTDLDILFLSRFFTDNLALGTSWPQPVLVRNGLPSSQCWQKRLQELTNPDGAGLTPFKSSFTMPTLTDRAILTLAHEFKMYVERKLSEKTGARLAESVIAAFHARLECLPKELRVAVAEKLAILVNASSESNPNLLVRAVLDNDVDAIETWAGLGARINQFSYGSCLPLVLAIQRGKSDAALKLMAMGADIYLQQNFDTKSAVGAVSYCRRMSVPLPEAIDQYFPLEIRRVTHSNCAQI